MSEWWTYSLSDFLLFSPRTYYRLFELYNADIWPWQAMSAALGVVVLVLLRREAPWRSRLVAAILAGCWIWVAWAFHWQRYSTINWAANYFAVAFAIEALLLIWTGVVRDRLAFEPATSAAQRIGVGVACFAMFLVPLFGPLLGRQWSQIEIFGAAPDPTAMATLGILLFAGRRAFWELLLIPVLWCVLSGAVAWTMGSPDAMVAPLAALLVVFAAARRANRH